MNNLTGYLSQNGGKKMLPKRIEEIKAEDVKRSKEIVAELVELDKADVRAMGAVAKHNHQIRRDELEGELAQLTKLIKSDLCEEILEDMRHANQYLEAKLVKEETEFFDVRTTIQPPAPPLQKVNVGGLDLVHDPSTTEKWEKANPAKEKVEERCRRVLVAETNRHLVIQLSQLLADFRTKVLRANRWSLDRFASEKQKVKDQILKIDWNERQEERLDLEAWTLLEYAVQNRNKVT